MPISHNLKICFAAVGVLLASGIHRDLFFIFYGNISSLLWFSGFGIVATMLGILTAQSMSAGRGKS